MDLWVIIVLILVIAYGLRNFQQVKALKSWISKRFAQWRKDRAAAKKLAETYRHIDMNADGKFDHKAHIRMLNQMRKAKK